MTVSKKSHPYLVLALLLFLTAILFWRVTGYDFINLDDPYLVQTNADLVRPLDWNMLIKPVAGLFHPLTTFTYWVDAQLFGMESAGPFHRTNLFFHLLSVVGIFLWIFRLTDRLLPATVLATVFAWHPTHVESVAWISERKDVVSVAFYLLALAAHAESLRGDRRKLWLLVTLAMGGLSLLAKPFAMSLPFVLLWIERWRTHLSFRHLAQRSWPFWLTSLAMSVTAALLVLKSQGDVRAKAEIDFLELAIRLPQQLLFYVTKTVWPTELKLLYSPPDLLPDIFAAIAVALFIAITAYAAYRSKEFRSNLIFGLGFFILTIGPMLKLVPFGDNTPVSDRYLYVSQTGLLWAWAMAMRPQRLQIAIAVPILLAFAALSWQCLPDWENAPAIWQSMLNVDPENADAHENLGRFFLGKEQHELALKHLQKGQTKVWDNAHNQAFVLMRMGKLQEASDKLAIVERVVPNDPKVLNLRGNLYMEVGDLENGEKYFRKSLATQPLLLQDLVRAEAQTNIGVVEFRRKNYQACVEWQNEALRSLPGYVYAIHNRGVCNYLIRNVEAAKADYEMTVRIEPGFAMAHNGLGAIALQKGELPIAEQHFRNALKADPRLGIAQENLARVLKMQGKSN